MEELNIKPLAKEVHDLSDIGLDVGVYFNPVGNFSLAKLPNGNWLCSMRKFGYFISSVSQAYLTTPEMKLDKPDEQLFLELDANFNIARQFQLVRNDYYKHPIFNVETPFLEDGRLVKWGGDLYLASAIFYQNNEHYEKFGIEVQRIELNEGTVEAKHVWSSVEHGFTGRHKNWMAIPDKPFNYVIGTSTSGAQTIDISSGVVKEVGRFDLDDLYRGNTNLIQTDDGYYTLTHKLGQDALERKKYIEYIVKYDRDLTPVAISRPFKLTDSSIEFVTTMLECGDGRLLVGVTEIDERPLAMTFDRQQLFNSIGL